jgi:hypothetical protein
MGYEEMSDAWDTFSSIPHDISGEDGLLRAALLAHKDILGLKGDPRPLSGTRTGHILLVTCIDADAIVALDRIPADALDANLAEALSALHGRAFAGAADLRRYQWDAAARVMAALGSEFSRIEDFIAWVVDEGATVPVEELRATWERWLPFNVASWDALNDIPARICAFRRAM